MRLKSNGKSDFRLSDPLIVIFHGYSFGTGFATEFITDQSPVKTSPRRRDSRPSLILEQMMNLDLMWVAMNFFPIRKCWRVKLMELQIRRRLLLSAKADNIPQPAPWTNRVKEKHELVKQNQALAITIQEMKRREDSTSYWYKELEKTRDRLYADIQRQRDRIKHLEARLANN